MKHPIITAVVIFVVAFAGISFFQINRPGNPANSAIQTAELNGHIRAGGRRTEEKSVYGEARGLIKKVLSLIYNRYEFGGPYGNKFFMASNNLSPETWDILKFKLATKMLTTNSTFLMTFSGSSVTAGHDNYYAQSYPYIFKKRMSEIFAKVGIELVVHDIAMGANNCSPYVLCYESMGGSDPDFLNWEQSYNCGHDDPVFEATARLVGSSKHKGIVYYSASGAWSPSSCPASTDKVPYCAEEWTPATAGLSEWGATESDVVAMKHQLFLFNQDKPSYARFTNSFRNDYKGVGMMGFNVWEQNSHCRFKNPKNGKDESCNGIDAVEGCSMKFMTHEASLYGSDNQKGANWHPTRAFHMLRGEAIAWIFGLVLSETVQMVENDLRTKSKDNLLTEYTSFLNELTPPLPNPKRCSGLHCEHKAHCFTDYKPHYSSNMTLSELVVGTHKWDYDPATLGEWSIHYGYLDAKPQFSGKAANGEIHFKITIHHGKVFWLCGPNKEALIHADVYLDANVKLEIPSGAGGNSGIKYTPSSSRVLLTKVSGADCREYSEIPAGTHVISVSTSAATPDHTSVITHLILWP
eukprot:gene8276-9842_t